MRAYCHACGRRASAGQAVTHRTSTRRSGGRACGDERARRSALSARSSARVSTVPRSRRRAGQRPAAVSDRVRSRATRATRSPTARTRFDAARRLPAGLGPRVAARSPVLRVRARLRRAGFAAKRAAGPLAWSRVVTQSSFALSAAARPSQPGGFPREAGPRTRRRRLQRSLSLGSPRKRGSGPDSTRRTRPPASKYTAISLFQVFDSTYGYSHAVSFSPA